MLHFSSFHLKPEMIALLNELGYVSPTPVQQQAISKILRGESLIARFQTGSGKTHAFLIPLMDRLVRGGLQTIIVSPTRELAQQTYAFAVQLKQATPIQKITLMTGGIDFQHDLAALSPLPELLIATPGRLLELLKSPFHQALIQAKSVVLDEADMLFDEAFMQTMDAYLNLLASPQLLAFSASLTPSLLGFLKRHIRVKETIEQDESSITPTRVKHALVNLHHRDVMATLVEFIQTIKPYKVMIFASTVAMVKKIDEYFNNRNIKHEVLHGDLTNRERRQHLKRIKQDEVAVIVASDIASRGLDIDHVSDIISVDLPMDLNYYFHRAGRAGRYQAEGKSYVFYQQGEQNRIDQLSSQGIHFDYLSFKDMILKPVAQFEPRLMHHQDDLAVRKEIKRAIAQTRSNQVKPGYKKKVKMAIDKVRRKFKRKAIQKIIRKRIYGTKEKS
jgi:ATP-dependent RNA helicase CshB